MPMLRVFGLTPFRLTTFRNKKKESDMIKTARHTWTGIAVALFGISLAFCNPVPGQAKAAAGATPAVPKYEIDPYWPKPLPNRWLTGDVGGVCVDAKDHVFIVNRQNLEEKETETAVSAPPVIEFDPDGNVVNSWGDPKVLPKMLHGCYVDYENNIWIAGSGDGIVQKYTHDGSKLLMQIGTKGVMDSSDGTADGRALNSSHTGFFKPSGVAVDPGNGDIYVADGYGNTRIAVFDRNGQFLRQWGRQGNAAETEAAVGGIFIKIVHCVVFDNAGLVYVCDKQGDRVQVFDKMGNFKRNFLVTPRPHYPNNRSTELGANSWIGFSPDPEQKFMFAVDEWRDQVDIFDHATGEILGTFSRPGHQPGEMTHGHTLAVDSKGNIYIGETRGGRRVQKFRMAGTQ
jgi:DNA-binding beta-propeller fold protein YncE